MFRALANKLSEYLISIGINPLYFLTLIAIPTYFLMYWKDLKNWDKLNDANKFFHITGFICIICMIGGCILELLGILK
jgi:4-hydroxybenzoate polyprenyltransferase